MLVKIKFFLSDPILPFIIGKILLIFMIKKQNTDGIRIDWKPKQMKKLSIYSGQKEKSQRDI